MTALRDATTSEVALAPPDGLSATSCDIWRELVPSRARSVGRLVLLEEALRARDQAVEYRRLLATQGSTSVTKTTGVMRLSPLIKAEEEALKRFVKIFALLGLGWDSNLDGRG